jgi:hypothetical protein
MSAIVTASQLRSILGVSSSLYSDAYLDDIIDTAEGVILPILTQNTTAIVSYELKSNVALFYVREPHTFAVGQSVVITKMPAPFAGTFTVTKVEDLYFTAALTNADVTIRQIIPNGIATLSGYGAATYYVGNPNVESAILAVSVEVFQSRTAAGGQIEGVDFSPTPFRMGRSLTNRCIGLLGDLVDTRSMVS